MCSVVIVCTLQIRLWTLEFRLASVMFHHRCVHTVELWMRFMKFMDIVCVAQCCVCSVHCCVDYKILKFVNFVVCICVHNVHYCLDFLSSSIFLCAFCNAQFQSMNFNTQGCYVTSWCALCNVHFWCVYICWKFKLCTSIGNPNLLSLFVHCVHKMGLGVQCACKTTKINWTLSLVCDKCSLLVIEFTLCTFQC